MSTDRSDHQDGRDDDRNDDRDHHRHEHHDDEGGSAALVTAITALSADTGASSSDFITSVALQTVTGTFSGTLRAGDSIQVSADGGAHWVSAHASGSTWSAAGVTLVSGSGTLITRSVDASGHILAGASHSYILDTSVLAPTLVLSFVDTGVSSTDGITSATEAKLTGTAEAGAMVKVYDGTALIATVKANASGVWTYEADDLTDGTHSFSATQTDIAGNLSAASAASAMIVDTFAAAPAVALAHDTGISATDHITSNGTLALGGVETGASVQYSIDKGKTWTSSFSAQEGANTVLVRQIDVAGNVSDATKFAFTLDTTAPVAPTLVATFVDSGASSTDTITNATSATLSGKAEAGAAVTLYDGTIPIATLTAKANGTWTYSVTGLADGTHSFSATQTDIAGNVSAASAASPMTVDTFAAAPAVALAQDTGFSATDHITSNGTLALNGVETGAVVKYSVDGGATWSSSFSAHEGTNSVQVRQTDLAGNTSAASTALSFTLDTHVPISPVATLSNDTGSSHSDLVTSDATLKLSGVESGATVQYSVDSGTTWTSSFSAHEGTNIVQVRQTDVAGTTSAASSLSFTLDTFALAPGVALQNDTGANHHDGITSNSALTGTAEAGATVALVEGATLLGTTTADSLGAWTFTPHLADGAHSLSVTETDIAGNVSAPATLAFTLDTQIGTPTISGVSSINGATVGYGTAEAGSSVTVHGSSNAVLGATTADGNGAWTFTFGSAPSSFDVTAVDVAGNASTASALYTVATIPVIQPPSLTADKSAASYTDTAAANTFVATTGQLHATDANSAILSYGVTGAAASAALSGYNLADAGVYGTVYVNSSSGAYAYVPNDAAINALPGGPLGVASESFTLTVSDSLGGSASTPLTIHLTGANDAPTLAASLTSASFTDTAAADAFAAVNGQLTGHDVDTGATLSYGVAGGTGPAATVLAGYNAAEAGSYGTLYLNSASGAYTYVPNNAAINALVAGANPTDSFSLTVSAASVSDPLTVNTASQPLTIHLTGANDTPVLTASLTAASYIDTAASDFFAAATGQLSASVADAGVALTYGVVGGASSTAQYGYDLAQPGAYGTVYVNSSTGAYTYVPNNAAINALPLGASATDSFTLTVSDGLAGGSASQPLTVQLTGAQDASIISGVMPFNYTVGNPAIVVAPSLTLSNVDAGTTTVTAATVAITAGYSAGNDVLSLTSALPAGMSATYGNNGVLTITGSGTLAQYQAILDSVAFQTTTAGGRTIGFTVFDGAVQSATVNTSNISLDNLSTIGFRLPGVSAGDASGFSVSGVGDFNGDGYADYIIGAPFAGANGSIAGASYVVYGGPSGFGPVLPLATLAGANGFSITGKNSYDRAGFAVNAAGDVNGDGFSDVIIGSPYANNGGIASGTNQFGGAYVVFGHAANAAASMNVSALDGTNGFSIVGAAAGDWAGYSVSGAGDVNGDGFADVIVGAPLAHTAHGRTGAAYVLFGHSGSFAPSIDLAHLTPTQGFELIGTTAGDWTGAKVSAAGDVNGDGISDLIIGTATPNGIAASATAYVVFGNTSGFGTVDAVTGISTVDLGSLNGTNGFRIVGAGTGPQTAGGFGHGHYSIHAAGDVNGDGFGDLIIGAPYASAANGQTGVAYVVFGQSGGFGTADPVSHLSDGAGTVNLRHLSPAQGFEIIGAATGDRAGYSVSAAGDVNGDGYGDLIIGAPNAKDNGGNPAGTSYVIFGSAHGFGTYDAVTHMDIVNLATLGGNEGFKISAVGPHNDSGYAVSAAGDVNGDGFGDLLVASSAATPQPSTALPTPGAYSGESYVIYGSKFITTSHTFVGVGGPGTSYTLQGSTADETFIAGQGNATMIGGGGVDSFTGGAGNDTIHLGVAGNSSSAFLKIDGGGGTNMLVLDGSGMMLDLTVPGVDGKVHNVEHIDLGSGNNTLVLNIHDVLNISGAGKQLFVTGNGADSVSSSLQGWMLDATHPTVTDSSGHVYDSYTLNGAAHIQGMANLLIDHQLLAANVHVS